MWPFPTSKPEQAPAPVKEQAIEDAIDELGLVRLNDLSGAMDKAMQKHLDPSSLPPVTFRREGFVSRPAGPKGLSVPADSVAGA